MTPEEIEKLKAWSEEQARVNTSRSQNIDRLMLERDELKKQIKELKDLADDNARFCYSCKKALSE